MQEHELILAQEFCSHHQVEMDFIYSLREYGLVQVINNEGTEYLSSEELSELEKIVRLHYDLNVNMEGIDVILHLLKQLEDSHTQMLELQNQLKFYR
jgi:hypothetical protein